MYKIYQSIINHSRKNNQKRIKDKRENSEKNIYLEFVKDKEIVFDIGASSGKMIKYFLKAGIPKIVALEPQEEYCQFLEKRFRNHNVDIIPKAVSDTNKPKKLFIDESKPRAATICPQYAKKREQENYFTYTIEKEIQTTTLQLLFEEYGLTEECWKYIYIKTDAEHHEKEILSTLPFLVDLSFEIHFDLQLKFIQCMNIISSFNEPFICNILRNGYFVFDKFVSMPELVDYVVEQHKRLVADVFIKKIAEKEG